MLRTLLIAVVTLFAAALPARAAPKDDVRAAANKLADAGSISWRSKL